MGRLKILGIFILMGFRGLDAHLGTEPLTRSWQTWNGTEGCKIESLFTPTTQDELVCLVQKAIEFKKPIKVIGAGHSLNAIALPEKEGWTISLENYSNVLEVDTLNQTITVQGGTTLKKINEVLDQHQLALENLGSISDQTIGGVFQTGTHGTGKNCGPIHTQILRLTLVNGKGVHKLVSPDETLSLFQACQCGLGTLGIIDTVTLRAVPARLLHERTFSAEWPDVLDQIDALVEGNDHFRFYWFPYARCAGIWTANRLMKGENEILVPPKESFSVPRLIEEIAKEQNNPAIQSIEDVLGLGPTDPSILTRFNRAFFEADYGAPYERIDRSDRIFNVDCSAHSHCHAMEAAFPIRYTKPFLLELEQLVEKNHFPAHGGVEVRFVKGDQALLSPTYSEDPNELFCFVNIVSIRPNNRPIPYEPYFEAFQTLVAKYQGRLHWGKMGPFDPSYSERIYPRWEQFRDMQKEEDPLGLFLNRFSKKALGY